MDLIDYGFIPSDHYSTIMKQDESSCVPGRVTAVHRERYELAVETGMIFGRLKTGVYYSDKAEEFPTAGDFVLINYISNGDSLIVKTLPRKSFFSRRDPTPGHGEQAVAANFDYVFIMQSLNSDFNIRRLERYLTLAWQSGAVPVVVLTKADLVDDYSAQVSDAGKITAGAAVHAISAKTGFGIDALSEYMTPRKTIVFLGSSGVGKSSLLNVLGGEEIMATNEIRDSDGRGRHTTTHRQLIMLKSGVMIIDTPGMRELGMWDLSTGLSDAFSDVEQYLGKCRFPDCRHISEPGCAVKEAIENGELTQDRWDSYTKLKREAEFSDDKAAYLLQKQQWHKDIAKKRRNINKLGEYDD